MRVTDQLRLFSDDDALAKIPLEAIVALKLPLRTFPSREAPTKLKIHENTIRIKIYMM
jgi:hypothetical protein